MIAGISGKVGQAEAQLSSLHGAKVIGVVRWSEPCVAHASGLVTIVGSAVDGTTKRIRTFTEGKDADHIFTAIGSSYFEPALHRHDGQIRAL
jgi:NADPH:quinone reductase